MIGWEERLREIEGGLEREGGEGLYIELRRGR